MQNLANIVMPSRCITGSHRRQLTQISQNFSKIKTLQASISKARSTQEIKGLQVDIGKAFQTLKWGLRQLKQTS